MCVLKNRKNVHQQQLSQYGVHIFVLAKMFCGKCYPNSHKTHIIKPTHISFSIHVTISPLSLLHNTNSVFI